MALRRTIDLLPEIFRTDTNRKFLAATLDQLTQEPNLKRTQGFVGRRVGPGVNPANNYVVEPTTTRSNYQLEPGVTFLKPNTTQVQDTITYPGFIDSLALQNGDVTRQDRLWESEYYSWDPFCDLDKFVNYSQYYWLPGGPESVDVAVEAVPLSDSFDVTRTDISYVFSGVPGTNPTITLARGGNYSFNVNQVGYNFWIQAAPGISGRLPATPNVSSRDVYGVVNNGEDQGTVEFYVPLKTSQDFYYSLAEITPVDLATPTIKFSQLNNVYVADFLAQYPTGIDGITQLNGRTIVFTNTIQGAEAGGWQIITDDSTVVDITMQSQRYSVWRINYVTGIDGLPYMQLDSILSVPNLSRFRILYGETYSSTQFYKDASGYFEQIPLLTAAQDVLYYQDSANPEMFGQIRLVDPTVTLPLDVNEIIGAKNYTSPNGVVFTNGLKVQFRGAATPAQFQNLEYYVEGVGTGPGITARVGFINGEAYFGAYHVYQGQKMTGLVHSTTVYQQNIYDTIEESLANPGLGGPTGAAIPQDPVAGAAEGNGIRLVPVNAMITPETYTKSAVTPYDSTAYDIGAFDASLNAPLIPDYLTQNRASADRNAWSRSNRWFHIDVINYTAEINGSSPVVNNDQRARRPIIEFRANQRLWNNGTLAKAPVNVIDFAQTDALSNINGQIGYGVDGYTFFDGTRVIFAADRDPQVRNRIYQVTFIDPTNSGTLVIDLVPTLDSEPLIEETVVSINGVIQQGQTHWFDGVTWQLAQQKSGVNQAPLFDVYDANGYSFGDRTIYPSSTFIGSKLFGYADGGNLTLDPVLGLSLQYLNINNVGDIVFDNYFYNDTFVYVKNSTSSELNISTGFVRQYIDRISFSDLLGWQAAAAQNRSRQVFQFTYTGSTLTLDVPVDVDSIYPPIQIYVEGLFIDPGTYTYTVVGSTTVITFTTQPVAGTIIEVQAISNQASSIGYYQVPLNLENNAINGNSSEFTLGTVRTHYESIGQNLRGIQGPINGANNSRDLGNILPYGIEIVQHSSPLVLPGVFLRRQQYELFNSLTYNNQEYNKYKALLLDLASRGDFVNSTPTQVLDAVTQEISIGRNEMFPFYWSDMLPAGETYNELTYTVTPISTGTFDLTQVYDFTSSNFQSVLVYLNGEILTRGPDYTASVGAATVVLSVTLTTGDVVSIREYPTTYGSFVPNTPTKMGLYPSWEPVIYIDESYLEPTQVIRGHDGSITVAFGDYRDQVLLEFETRIYNNLKIVSPIPLDVADVVPGQFRTTDYTLDEINNILLPDFLSWIGWNKLDYTSQTYVAGDPFTYNYSQSGDRLTKQPLLGAWRGIYNYFYDTTTPNTTPWEMLGFSEEPSWWQEQYGSVPYTSGNLVLWEDLEAGLIADPDNPRIDPRYARPGLTQVIPSGDEGQLLNPLDAVVGNFDSTSFRRSWAFGDDGPVESAWRTSSAWPFAVMRLLALTKPAQFFNLFVDRDRYVYDDALEQYLWDQRYRIVPENIQPLYGNGVSRASYINWIVDYNRQRGVDSSQLLANTLHSLNVQLCWRMASFSDKRYLKIYTERSTPTGQNASLLLPDESYQLLLYQNSPLESSTYSSVIVQTTSDGWAVLGYNSQASYFEILASRPTGVTITISAGGSAERVPVEYTNTVVRVPYGFVFTNRAALCDFLMSYGELLTQRGFAFEGTENGYIMNWTQMAQEFLYWSNQGWTSGSIINLNPGATRISITRPGVVAESLSPPRLDSIILNQNSQAIPPGNLVIDRFENTLRVTSLNADTINYLNVRFTAFEHVMVLDNRSIFADLIYDPVTGARQSRVLVSGWLSGDWNGTVNAPGFVLNQDNIQEWVPNRKYTKGDIVLFKDQYWSAGTIIQPSAKFDYSVWVKSDYADIQKGLLPNSPNASDQLSLSYSVYNANLETEVDLFSYGLIGFRPRQYMAALNLDDVSQVQLYQQFLGSKGTRPAAEIFTFADLGKEVAQYDIYEYWAMLRSTYGANANRSFFEVLLEAAKLESNPSLVQIIQPDTESQADQTVFVSDILKSNYKITSPNILPTTLNTPDNSLPGAGYVDIDDVDITVFDLSDNNVLAAQLDTIGIDTSIWVARVNTYDWTVYRAEKVPGTIVKVEDNLESASIATFNQAHGLNAGDTLIIKYFSNDINGVYQVLSVPTITTVIIDYTFSGFQTAETGVGLGLTLQPSRVQQPADVSLLPYADQLLPGVMAWVDNDGTGHWIVLEKTDPFVETATLVPKAPEPYSQYGATVAQGLSNLSALVGAPNYNPSNSANAPGVVYSYVKNDRDIYEQNSLLTLTTTDTIGYGNAVDIGDQSWAIVGASQSNSNQGYVTTIYVKPGSNFFEQRQLLVAPDQDFANGEFGYAVVMSMNERWMYISAPGLNRVHAYTRVDVEQQSVEYLTSDTVISYNWSDYIVADYIKPDQINVVLDNVLLTYETDYVVTPTNITFFGSPSNNKLLTISRRNAAQLDQALVLGVTATTTGSGSGAEFTVNNVRGVYTVNLTAGGIDYTVGDTLTIDQDTVATPDAIPPAPIVTSYVSGTGVTITVANTTGIMPGMIVVGNGFTQGQYVEVVPNGTDLVLNQSPDGAASGALTFSYDIKVFVTEVNALTGAIVDFTVSGGTGVTTQTEYNITNYLATVTDIYSFSVKVDNVLQRPKMDYDFNSDSSIVDPMILVFTTVPPAGAVIAVSSESYFNYVGTLPTAGLGLVGGERFGQSIACDADGSQVTVGCPGKDNNTGVVYVFDRNTQRFIVNNSAQTEYQTVQDLDIPGFISVTQNGVVLIPSGLNINGQYTVDVTNPADQFVNITSTLNVGDVIEISTNQFTLLKTIESVLPAEGNQFGSKLDQCPTDYGVYIASPFDSAIQEEAGSVEFYQNQTEVYGSITSTIANPVLTAGEYIRLDNTYVELTGTTISALVDDIVAAQVPNITATLTPNLTLEGDGSTKIFDVGSIYSSAASVTSTVVYVNGILQNYGSEYTYDSATQQIIFTTAPFNTSNILVVSGRIIISVENFSASVPGNRLKVLPGTGTLFADLGINPYAYTQTIVSPVSQKFAHFGQGLYISENTTTLIVGAPNGSMIRATTFDLNQTVFDSDSTSFSDTTLNSGAVYSFDALSAVNASVDNPKQFVFGQQFTNNNLQSLDQFGTAVDYTTGILLAGTPGYDRGDSSGADFGQVLQYHNLDNLPAWQIKRRQLPAVDISLMDTVFMYDRVSGNTKQYFDYFDPLQGTVLGVVRQNLDFIGGVDPAAYNVGLLNNYGVKWGEERVGQIWWDTNNVRFIDPHQSIGIDKSDIVYASRRWGQLFPGSTVDMYQWIVSDVAPANYTGPGTPKDITSYVISSSLTDQGFVTTQYYFWVTGISTVNTAARKTLSIDTLRNYIENPRASGIAYIAPINSSTIAIYNGLQYISADDTIFHIEFDKQFTEAAVHVEYQLIPQGRADGFLNDTLYRKMLDSFTGSDTTGNPVPDPFLSPTNQYGVEFRPRQSMFVNRFLALKNYLGQANTVLAQFPIVETRSLALLNSYDPEPAASTGAWDKRVANLEELSYQNLNAVPLGYKYLVSSDSNNNGLWTIYQVAAIGTLLGEVGLNLIRVQNYDTRNYWSTIDWYSPSYNQYTRISLEVPNESALETITVAEGSAVKVIANAQGKWEIYLYSSGNWTRVGLQNGTVEFSKVLWDYAAGRFGFDSEVFDAQYYDQAPIIETRKIIEAINQELLIGDLLIERNNLLMLIFNYILSEQQAPNWLIKTSLIDVDHTIRDLVPFQIYRRDNQDFVLDYINEVKPYHVQIREFNLRYQGLDRYLGSLTDYDLPAYYDPLQKLFVSPVLDNTGTLSTTSSVPSTSPIWQTFPYNQWFQNYLLSIESVTIVSSGSGYSVAPEVVVTGNCLRQAVMTARINSAGEVVEITVLDAGAGYSETATITFDSGSGSGALAVAVMGNGQVRNIVTTIKYDRYQYASTIQEWIPNVNYDNGDQVRYANIVWAANSDDSTGVRSETFDPTQWVKIDAATLSGVDRTMGFYTPTVNQPGLDLAQLISGVDYPGVQVDAPDFDQNTGFDVGNFDVNPYDNISYGPEGAPTYDPAILDAIYESNFVDPYLGTLPTSINVDGGAFVDAYESHAPEELVPGITYDTLDFRVYTTPGADWSGDGHGFPMGQRKFEYDPASPELDFAGVLTYPVQVRVFNQTTEVELSLDIDYTINWVNFVVTMLSSNGTGDIIAVVAYALGGGNQVYTDSYIGSDIVDTVIIPFPYDLITDFAIFSNGTQVTDYTASAVVPGRTLIEFGSSFVSTDRVTITALGSGSASVTTGWSTPVTQYILSDGSLSYTLTNSVQGTNPINAIVNKNGVRARPSQGIEYTGNGSQLTYALPDRGGYDQSLIGGNDVSVYINNVAQTLGVNFVLDPDDGSTARSVTLTTAPAIGATVLISVRTKAQYWIVGNTITFQPAQGLIPVLGDVITVTTFNDTAEQNMVTHVFVGPTTQGTQIAEGYDITLYDEGNIPNALGSFDYSTGIIVSSNAFNIGQTILSPERLVVTLDGRYLFPDTGYTVDGSTVTVLGPVINAAQIVAITMFAQEAVPSAMAFRIFQDMRGQQTTYRITPSTTATVTQAVLATDDIIYVDNANALAQPNLPNGFFGLITINGERITYRYRDTVANTVSGLRRGTAGTGAAAHAMGSLIYDIGAANLLAPEYQDRIVAVNFLGNGVNTDFITPIVVETLDSTEQVEAIQVFVGGTLQQGGYTIESANPVLIQFNEAPANGYQVSIQVRQGESWYQPGTSAPSNGVPLQNTNTPAARFLRGE